MSSRLLWEGDEKWTAEAVTNLVKNASEHSPEGGLVKISVSKDVLNLWITVEDNGPGIPELDMPICFGDFIVAVMPLRAALVSAWLWRQN